MFLLGCGFQFANPCPGACHNMYLDTQANINLLGMLIDFIHILPNTKIF